MPKIKLIKIHYQYDQYEGDYDFSHTSNLSDWYEATEEELAILKSKEAKSIFMDYRNDFRIAVAEELDESVIKSFLSDIKVIVDKNKLAEEERLIKSQKKREVEEKKKADKERKDKEKKIAEAKKLLLKEGIKVD